MINKCKKKYILKKSIRLIDFVSFLGFNVFIIYFCKVDFKFNEIFIFRNNRNVYFFIIGENFFYLKILMNLYYVLFLYLLVFGLLFMNLFDVNFI